MQPIQPRFPMRGFELLIPKNVVERDLLVDIGNDRHVDFARTFGWTIVKLLAWHHLAIPLVDPAARHVVRVKVRPCRLPVHCHVSRRQHAFSFIRVNGGVVGSSGLLNNGHLLLLHFFDEVAHFPNGSLLPGGVFLKVHFLVHAHLLGHEVARLVRVFLYVLLGFFVKSQRRARVHQVCRTWL